MEEVKKFSEEGEFIREIYQSTRVIKSELERILRKIEMRGYEENFVEKEVNRLFEKMEKEDDHA